MHVDLSVDQNMPIFDAARTGKPVWITGEAEILLRYPHLGALREKSSALTWGAIPLTFEGRTIGSLGLRCVDVRPLSPEDEQFLLGDRPAMRAGDRAGALVRRDASRARSGGTRQPGEGRVSRDARPRAAQSAGADRHRAQLMKLRGEVQLGAGAGDHRAPGEPPGAPRRRSPRRLADHARQDRARAGGWSSSSRSSPRRSRWRARCSSSAAHNLVVDVPRQGMWSMPTRRGWRRWSRTCSPTPRSTPSPAARSRCTRGATAHEIVAQVSDNGIGIRAGAAAAASSICSSRASARQTAPRAASASAWRWCATSWQLHGGTVAALSDGAGKGSEFVVRLPARRTSRLRRKPTCPDHGGRSASADAAPHARRRRQRGRRIAAGRRCSTTWATRSSSRTTVREALALVETFTPEVARARHRPAGDGRLRARGRSFANGSVRALRD